MHEATRGPLKGDVSAQKALQGSETDMRELLGGTEENSVSPTRGIYFVQKGNRTSKTTFNNDQPRSGKE